MSTDIHHHMLPPVLAAALAGHGVHAIGGEPVPAWEPQASLDIMDRSGIARAILSAPVPLHFLDPGQAAAMAGGINRFGEDCTQRQPGLYQGDPQLDPLYAELDKRHAVAFIHPAVYTAGRYPVQPGDGLPVPGIQPSQLEFGFDATRAVANLLISQVDQRFPGIRFVFTHSGACVPSVLHKLLDRKPVVDAYTAHIRDHGTPPPAADLLRQLHAAEARQRVHWL